MRNEQSVAKPKVMDHGRLPGIFANISQSLGGPPDVGRNAPDSDKFVYNLYSSFSIVDKGTFNIKGMCLHKSSDYVQSMTDSGHRLPRQETAAIPIKHFPGANNNLQAS